MANVKLLKMGGVSALAAGLALVALPGAALAQEHHRVGGGANRWGGGGQTPVQPQVQTQASGSWNRGGDGNGSARNWRGGGQAQVQTQAPSRNGGDHNWQGRGGGGQVQVQNQARTWSHDGNRGGNWQGRSGSRGGDAQAQPQRHERQQTWNGGTHSWSGSDRNWSGGDRNWNGGDRNWNGGDRNWNGGNRTWNGGNHNQWQDRNRTYRNNSWGYGNTRNWNRSWRNDNRYDWRGYRSHNRDVYRLGRYYSPYNNWSYRRLSAGFFLEPLFYGSSYWIDDPWQYRLPEAYGPYRWVRYYDDALLVDIYTGEVVDAIYDFFW